MMNRWYRQAVEQASHRWRAGRRDDSARTRRKTLISTQVLEPGAPAPSLDDLERDARELRAQLAAERDLGRKRDAIIARYEHWYSALKASAAARRRPSHEGSFEA